MKHIPETFDNTFDYEELDLEIHGAKDKKDADKTAEGFAEWLQVRHTKQNRKKKEGREYFRPSVMFAYAVNPGQIPGMHFPSKTDIVPAWIRK